MALKVNVENTKKGIIAGGLQGLIFSAGMAGFDYLDRSPFDINQFLFYFISFGTIMGFTAVYSKTKKK